MTNGSQKNKRICFELVNSILPEKKKKTIKDLVKEPTLHRWLFANSFMKLTWVVGFMKELGNNLDG